MSAYKKCILYFCKERETNVCIRLFRFPSDTKRLKIWLKNLNLPSDFVPKDSHYVCSNHFEPTLLGIKRLKINAIPTLNLGYTEMPPYLVEIREKHRHRKCCIINCPSTSEEVTLYKIPTDPTKKQIWLESIKIKQRSNPLICALHFEDKYIIGTRLKKDAVPTLKLTETADYFSDTSSQGLEPAGTLSKPTFTSRISSPGFDIHDFQEDEENITISVYVE